MLCIDIDAFKPEYLRYTSYLRSLAKDSLHGNLETVLGFTGIAGTFLTGTYPDKHGIVSMFTYSPDSRLRWLRNLSFLGRSLLTPLVNLSNYLHDDRFFFRMPRINPAKMAYFDTCARKSFVQENRMGVPSLYDMLNRHGKTFVSIDWPNIIGTGTKSVFLSQSKDKVVDVTLKVIEKSKPDLCFTHFFELDYVAHEYGTGSPEVKNEVRAIDEAVARLDADEMLIFSDTGMLDVTGKVDVLTALQGTGLEFGKDLVYFMDSTMVRFWFLRKGVEKDVGKVLEGLRGGHALSGHEIKDVYRLPEKHCDMIFLADPGILVSPNYFQGSASVKSMHGWDVRHKDQLAFYLLKSPGKKKDAKMVDMLPTLLKSMGLPSIRCDGKSLL